MLYTTETLEEINILVRYNLQTTQEGIKVHSDADAKTIAATKRLFEKDLISQIDGGYLTDLGRKAAEHAQDLLQILNKNTSAQPA